MILKSAVKGLSNCKCLIPSVAEWTKVNGARWRDSTTISSNEEVSSPNE